MTQSGQMAQIASDVDYIARRDSELEKAIEELKQNVASASQADLGISELLEKQRQQHLIPTGCFGTRPVFDWVHVYQIGDKDRVELYETYGASKIVMPENYREARRDQACRGVLLAAGPAALDMLRTNGIEVGHTVRFVKFSPFRLLGDYVRSKEFWFLAMRAESIESSETLEQEIREKKAEVIWDATFSQHVVSRDNHILGLPKTAWSQVDEDAK